MNFHKTFHLIDRPVTDVLAQLDLPPGHKAQILVSAACYLPFSNGLDAAIFCETLCQRRASDDQYEIVDQSSSGITVGPIRIWGFVLALPTDAGIEIRATDYNLPPPEQDYSSNLLTGIIQVHVSEGTF